MSVLDVSTEMPNLSANADRPITGNVLKVSVKENEVPTEKILVVRVFSLHRQVVYQIKAKRLNYFIIAELLHFKLKSRISRAIYAKKLT